MVVFVQNSVFGEIQFSCYYKNLLLPKKTKILKNGARSDRGSPNQNESPIRPFQCAIVRFSGTLSWDINDLKKLFRFFENLQKHPGQLG